MDRLIPYDAEVYLSLIRRYNEDIWPAQLIALAFGWLIVMCARRGGALNGRIVYLILAGFWVYTGTEFLLLRFATLNWAAQAFGFLFLAQGVLIVFWGTILGRADVSLGKGRRSVEAIILLVLAAALHPLATLATGLPLVMAQPFGLAPLSVVLVTLGVFRLTDASPCWLLAWPLLWGVWELANAWTLNIVADTVTAAVAAAGVLYTVIIPRILR